MVDSTLARIKLLFVLQRPLTHFQQLQMSCAPCEEERRNGYRELVDGRVLARAADADAFRLDLTRATGTVVSPATRSSSVTHLSAQ